MKLENKVALVTGASNGMGREIALRFAREGADVAVSYYSGATPTDGKDGEEVVRLIQETGRKSVGIDVNLAKEEDIISMVDQTIKAFGRIDILVNCAGVFIPPRPLCEITAEQFDFIMDVDIRGVFLICKYTIPHMVEQGKGVIVNIGSASGIRGTGLSPLPYITAKFGMMGLTQEVDAEYGTKGVRCNILCPGAIDTRMNSGYTEETKRKFDKIPARRMGTVQDIANLALFLASDDSDYIHGESILIDGGKNLRWSNL
ncbi:SDR family NAD(P)-dependent oxidoreductase [Harryflintia acetispora]|uniref:3-oxoacyl-[acyl-carrier protein] reductase n=1 Tax=Harryflintia acetispora TaxID=1849041 RepID=A0A9X8Y9B6_9FIRM|nr:SDR family NAD(P)-dependent oxidoreductase [Harryflintia acetispora]TCL45351.1 3-oxoacyl-[acyl-carrier protein] reductase [Harryflintia acetispora]